MSESKSPSPLHGTARTRAQTPASASPNLDRGGAADNSSIDDTSFDLQQALTEAEDRIARMTVDHSRELAALRSEVERVSHAKERLENMLEEAKQEQLAAEDTATAHEREAQQVKSLKLRLSHEAESSRKARGELEAAEERVRDAESRAERESEEMQKLRDEIGVLQRQNAHLAEMREIDIADFDTIIRNAEAELQRALEENAALKADISAEPGTPAGPPPPVPSLNLHARFANPSASPRGAMTDMSARGAGSFAGAYVHEPGTGRLGQTWREEQAAGRHWSRKRDGSTDPSPRPTPRFTPSQSAHIDLYKPPSARKPESDTDAKDLADVVIPKMVITPPVTPPAKPVTVSTGTATDDELLPLEPAPRALNSKPQPPSGLLWLAFGAVVAAVSAVVGAIIGRIGIKNVW